MGKRQNKQKYKPITKRNNDFFIEDLEKHLERSKNKAESSIKQFDTLMIAISTVGIGFVTAYIKDMNHDLFLARLSQLIFVACLFLNLFSHMFSSWVNRRVEKYALEELNFAKYKCFPVGIINEVQFEEFQTKRYDNKRWLDCIIITLNMLSFISLSFAVSLFLFFARQY
jgi:hypothetical protein